MTVCRATVSSGDCPQAEKLLKRSSSALGIPESPEMSKTDCIAGEALDVLLRLPQEHNLPPDGLIGVRAPGALDLACANAAVQAGSRLKRHREQASAGV